ncbi:GAF domain-containing protein [Methylobacterium sp. WL12]|uniref:GAF domain-containing protein n=1 Tax=Methylobacterium sp. WL12 TaxID=2603890 RepID=UPI001650A705|nr:GAF domain-containing protein [Methylobacterium sp. WL12]
MGRTPWSVILDPDRLNDLRSLNILDTTPEQSYDDLAELARIICDTPVANITLVAADRQWFKSRIGSEVDETPIELSVCAYALAEPDALVINDLTSDLRTRDNVLVTGDTSLRFYAGVPLRLDASYGVGTLCVLDTKPHVEGLTKTQIAGLQALGRQATILFNIRKFIARQHSEAQGSPNENEMLFEAADNLMAAHKIAKGIQDEILEKLLSKSLTHVGRRIAKDQLGQSMYLN